MNNRTQTINITVPKELLKQVDALAKRDYTSRSDIIRQALLGKIRQTQLDEWGDEGNWETVVDFRDLPGGGMSSKEFIERLKKLDGQNK
ncbi:MAG: ribbon-helix-helix domain-containing protein [Patescibacteria group bacterium]